MRTCSPTSPRLLRNVHHERLERRLTQSGDPTTDRCAIPDCGRPTMRATGKGLAEYHCGYHVQHRARHGSHWCPTYRASEVRPYLIVASYWIKERRTEPFIKHALIGLKGLLDSAGHAERAQDIKWRTAASRARVAFARLREANVKPERLLAIHMAVSALIEDDAGSHRIKEYRIVQVAKAAHRLASGTHEHWDIPRDDGSTRAVAFHAYPKSSGRVLRVIGAAIEELCSAVTQRDLEAVRDLKRERFGKHPSQLPGWKPLWKLRLEAAATR
jgi:hypothetical protein